MLTVTRNPLTSVTNTHYAMAGSGGRRRRDADDAGYDDSISSSSRQQQQQQQQRRSARVTEKENEQNGAMFVDDGNGFVFRSKFKAGAGPSTSSSSLSSSRAAAAAAAARMRNGGDGEAVADSSSSTTSGVKRKQLYDQEDDGFTFTRAKPKRSRMTATTTSTTTRTAATSTTATTEEVNGLRGRRAVVPDTSVAEETEHQHHPDELERSVGQRRVQKRRPEDEATTQRQAEELVDDSTAPAPQAKRRGRPPAKTKKKKEMEVIPSAGGADNDDEEPPPPPPSLEVKRKRPRQQHKKSPGAAPTNHHLRHVHEEVPPRASTPVVAGTTKIALPFADTPIIRKNREMRRRASGVDSGGSGGDRSGRGSRRSSLGQRGRRASSLIDSGRSSALPHDAVDSAEFFKHIETALPEPRRMRQLLTWCATRALAGGSDVDKKNNRRDKNGTTKTSSNMRESVVGPDSHVKLAAREIQNQILKDLSARDSMSNWFDRPEELETGRETVLKKPNPRNEANEKKIRELEAQLARLQSERSTWETLLKPPSSKGPLLAAAPIPDVSDLLSSSTSSSSSSTTTTATTTLQAIDPTQLTASNAAVLGSLRALDLPLAGALQAGTQRRVAAAAAGLEFAGDRLADSAHALRQYRDAADRVADRVLDDAAAALTVRARARAGSQNVALRDVLRGLSRVEPR